MIAKTRAIILKNTNYSENSVISKMYTREFGLRSYIFQSIRKGKSAIRLSMIQPCSLVEMDVYEKSSSNINRVKELKNNPLLFNIQESMVKKAVSMFLIEVINHCITEEQCDEELFDFLDTQILSLEQKESDSLFPIRFLLLLSKYLGIEPQGEYSANTPYLSLEDGVYVSETGLNSLRKEPSLLISFVLKGEEDRLKKVAGSVRRDTLNQLIRYYQYHVIKNKKIKSVEILSELLE